MNAYDSPSKNGNFSLRFKTNCWYSPKDVLYENNSKDNIINYGGCLTQEACTLYFQNSLYDLLST